MLLAFALTLVGGLAVIAATFAWILVRALQAADDPWEERPEGDWPFVPSGFPIEPAASSLRAAQTGGGIATGHAAAALFIPPHADGDNR